MSKFTVKGFFASQLTTEEAVAAKKVLDFDGEGWEEMHIAIQSGAAQVPETVMELQHASDVLAAIQKGDREAMLEALVCMDREVTKHENLVNSDDTIESLILAKKSMLNLKENEPLIKRGRAFVNGNKHQAWYTEPLIEMCQVVRCKNPSYKADEVFYTLDRVMCKTPILRIERDEDDIDILGYETSRTVGMSLKQFRNFMTKHKDKIGKRIRISKQAENTL